MLRLEADSVQIHQQRRHLSASQHWQQLDGGIKFFVRENVKMRKSLFIIQTTRDLLSNLLNKWKKSCHVFNKIFQFKYLIGINLEGIQNIDCLCCFAYRLSRCQWNIKSLGGVGGGVERRTEQVLHLPIN